MRTVFADSAYWIALINPNDDLHRIADELSKQYTSILTSEMVLVEVAAYFAKGGKHLRTAVVSMVRAIGNNSNCTVVGQTREQFSQALSYYAEHDDKEWSLVDCASMVLMKERTIREVLSFDHHFEQAQFRALMRE